MGKIELSYAWSTSRVKLLRECLYKYYLNYILSWGGWLKTASPERKQAYLLKNMTNLYMWIGSIVHDEIEGIIGEIRRSGDCRSVTVASDNITQKLREGWVESKQKEWKQDPKRKINLAEHYYNKEMDKDFLLSLKEKALRCIQAFYDSPIFKMMHEISANDWLSIEEFQSFNLATGEKVSVKIDCGFRYQGKIYLFDWKTGKIQDDVINQLVTYAMYALKKKWTTNLKDIVIVPVFLAAYHNNKETAIPFLNVKEQQILRQAQIIKEESKLLKEAHENKENLSFFEYTDNYHACKFCHFREMCDKWKK
jgi:hypothetical protein